MKKKDLFQFLQETIKDWKDISLEYNSEEGIITIWETLEED